MTIWPEPSEQNGYLTEHIQLLRDSFRRVLNRDLLDISQCEVTVAKAIYHAPYMLVSHGTEADPLFNYANLVAQKLFEMSWAEFIQLPSRQSAEPPNREERAQLLATVTSQGYLEHYSGIRISKTGRRFWISDATVWNLRDRQENYYGQAAICSQWEYL